MTAKLRTSLEHKALSKPSAPSLPLATEVSVSKSTLLVLCHGSDATVFEVRPFAWGLLE